MPARRRPAALALVAGLASALLSSVLPAAPAAAAVSPPAPVVRPGCAFDEDLARAHEDADGTVRGFYGLSGNESFTCTDGGIADGRIWAFTRSGGRWTSVRSPYTGKILSVTGDSTGTYLLYARGDGIWITKRTTAGVFTAGRRLSPFGLGTRISPTGDVVARGGRWWAVWDENLTPDRIGQTELFQAKTIGAPLDRSRITTHPDRDGQASLALRPDGGAALVWSRHDPDRPTVSVHLARSDDGRRWTSTTLSGDASVYRPDVLVVGGTTWVALNTRRGPTVGEDSTGRLAFRSFAVRGNATLLAASAGRVFLATTAQPFGPPYLYTRGTDGRWSGQRMAGGEGLLQSLTAGGGRATATWSQDRQLFGARSS